MSFRRLVLAFLFFAAPCMLAAQSVADRLRELDRLRDEGIISEEVYEKQWNEVLEQAMRSPPPAPTYASVPRLSQPKPVLPWEIMLAGSWLSFDSGPSESEMYSIDVSLGYRLNDYFDVIIGADHTSSEVDGDEFESTGASLGLDFNLSPADASIVPYIGAGASWVFYEDDQNGEDDDWAWHAHVGVRQYIGDRVVIKYQATYQSFPDIDLEGIAATVGIGVRRQRRQL